MNQAGNRGFRRFVAAEIPDDRESSGGCKQHSCFKRLKLHTTSLSLAWVDFGALCRAFVSERQAADQTNARISESSGERLVEERLSITSEVGVRHGMCQCSNTEVDQRPSFTYSQNKRVHWCGRLSRFF